MPSHAGPNTAGESNIVFSYDIGDTSNSYRGEPTTNLWDTMLNTQSLRSHTKHFWDGKQWIVDATYTHPGVDGPKGVYLGLVFKHVSGAFNSTWSGTSYGYMLRDIACTSGATMTQSVWIYLSENCNLDGVPSAIEQESGGESSVAGYAPQYDLNNKGTWQVIAKKAISDGQVRFIPLYPRKNGTTVGEFTGFLMWALPQVTYGDHVVQPIQPGTIRSSTQGLLPLLGNTSINLSSVSFDSNAQMVFDGTDDFIESTTNLTPLQDLTSGTAELIFKWNGSTSYTVLLHLFAGSSYYGTTIGLGNWTGAYDNESIIFMVSNASGTDLTSQTYYRNGTFTYRDGLYHHLVVTTNGSTVQIYLDGNQLSLTSTASSKFSPPTITKLQLGKRDFNSGTGFYSGEIPIVKIYNTALSANQIKQNFQQYKTRFNLS